MDIDKLREDLIIDEGTKNEIYLDHLGLPTFGIGHLVTEWDEEYELPVGTAVSPDRVNQCFQVDVYGTIDECKILFEDFDELPEEVQLIIGNLMFNMGRPRLSKFVLFRQAVKDRDWIECGNQLKNSRYYTQVTARADRLIARLQAI
jgi:GH24 family phage-related lysozyme (muramidase)